MGGDVGVQVGLRGEGEGADGAGEGRRRVRGGVDEVHVLFEGEEGRVGFEAGGTRVGFGFRGGFGFFRGF